MNEIQMFIEYCNGWLKSEKKTSVTASTKKKSVFRTQARGIGLYS